MSSKPDYNEWHMQYVEDDDTQSSWHRFVKDNLPAKDMKDKVLLEIGCGRGGLSNYLASSSTPPTKLFACDFSSSALKIAESKFGAHQNRVTWKTEDIQQLSFEDNSFDVVISCETIEHVPDPGKAVKELFRVLKPGGKLYLTCPNYFNFFGLWCVYRYLIRKPYTEGGQPYVNYLLLPKLLIWLNHAGFKTESYYTTNLVFPLRAHFHFFLKRMPYLLKWLGLQTFFILRKP